MSEILELFTDAKISLFTGYKLYHKLAFCKTVRFINKFNEVFFYCGASYDINKIAKSV